MALDLAAGAAPIFFTKNYFSADANLYGGTFSVTSNTGLGPRLYDMDPFSYWLSSGSTDGDTQTIINQLYEGYASAQRTIQFLAILNCNLKNFTVDYSVDGGTNWTNIITVTGNTAPDYLLDLTGAPLLLVNAIRVQATTTFAITGLAAAGEKQVGTIVACDYLWQMTRPPNKLRRKYLDNQKIVVLADGSQDITYIKRSPASHEFYACDMTFSLLPMTDRDQLRTIRRVNPNFCLAPEPGDRLGDIFYGRFNGNWEDGPTAQYKGSGNDVTVPFMEISS